jgi:hypothetical protein
MAHFICAVHLYRSALGSETKCEGRGVEYRSGPTTSNFVTTWIECLGFEVLIEQ